MSAANRTTVLERMRNPSSTTKSAPTSRGDLVSKIKTTVLPTVTASSGTTQTAEDKAAAAVINDLATTLEPTEGYLYILPAVDKTGYTSASADLAFGTITKTGPGSSASVGRYVLYLKDQAFTYGPGAFVPWGAVVSLL